MSFWVLPILEMQFIIFLPLPIPGAVHSLVLLFLALCLGFVKLEHIKDVAATSSKTGGLLNLIESYIVFFPI